MTSTSEALSALEQLTTGDINLSKLSDAHDMLKLLGVVLGHLALIRVVTDKSADARAKVAAARALTNLKESPESTAERIRRSPFADMSFDQLEAVVKGINPGEDLSALVSRVKKT